MKKRKTKEKKAEHHHIASAKQGMNTEKEIAMDFAVKAHKKFDRMIKASVLFGSQVRNKSTVGSDIDIILILDDASINWDLELISWYREELGKLVANEEYAKELHINTIKLTSWWRDLIYGDPVVLNIVRYGEALIDSGGFFNPLKALLLQGKIHSTPEAVYAALQRAPAHLARSKISELNALEGVYWTMIDSAQAALMMAGKIPPSPEHIPEMLRLTFVDSGMLKMSSVNAIKDIYNLHKMVTHSQVLNIKGAQIDQWQDTAEKFMAEMTSLVDKLIESKKN